MTHSWLITGPPGSGRSNLAYAFATALLSPGTPDGDLATRRQVEARTHPDLAVLSTERVIISIDEVRSLVASSQFSPSVGRYRVMVIEDADRMTERTSNVLLKALEEPPERTVWMAISRNSSFSNGVKNLVISWPSLSCTSKGPKKKMFPFVSASGCGSGVSSSAGAIATMGADCAGAAGAVSPVAGAGAATAAGAGFFGCLRRFTSRNAPIAAAGSSRI